MNFNLKSSYETNFKDFINLSPTPGNSRLLSINASPAEIEFYQEAGWAVDSLILTEDLAESWSESKKMIVASIYDPIANITGKYHHVVLNYFIQFAPEPPEFIKKLKTILYPGGKITCRFVNQHCYHQLFRKASREIFPWPDHLPSGRQFLFREIQDIADNSGLNIVNVDVEMDKLWFDSGIENWRFVEAIDCKVVTPLEKEKKKPYFIRCFLITFEHQALVQEIARNLNEQADGELLHEKIQQALENSEFDLAHTLLKRLMETGKGDDRTYNMLGIYHFYQQEFDKAYISFMDALRLNQLDLDYYRNLYDVSLHLNRQNDVQQFMNSEVKNVPGLNALIQELFGA